MAFPALIVLVAVLLTLVGMFFWRLRAIGSRVGSFQCALLVADRWHAGIATYSQHHLNWHRVVSLAMTPTRKFDRREFHIEGRQPHVGQGADSHIVQARCTYQGREILVAADKGALDGLVSWLEASPPHTHR